MNGGTAAGVVHFVVTILCKVRFILLGAVPLHVISADVVSLCVCLFRIGRRILDLRLVVGLIVGGAAVEISRRNANLGLHGNRQIERKV